MEAPFNALLALARSESSTISAGASQCFYRIAEALTAEAWLVINMLFLLVNAGVC